MPVHCYGCPCDVEAIDAIAKRHNLKVIYDAAHAFGVKYKGKSILEWGDLSTLSFHATKVYNTIEGGAMVMHTPEMKYDVDNLKNFGFRGETNVVAPGINSKMDEMRSAYGLLNLRQVDAAIAARKHVAEQYVAALKDMKGIKLFPYEIEQTLSLSLPLSFNWNFAYFPILITPDFRMTRDELYEHMKSKNVLGRRYFYPLITDFEPYKDLVASPSGGSRKGALPIARRIADQVICLPMHHKLSEEDIQRIINCIVK